MAQNIPDCVPEVQIGVSSEQNATTNQSLETDRRVEDSREAVTGDGPTPSAAPGSKRPRKRADQGHLHATRHGILSRHLLEALKMLGEDIKPIRRLERRFRKVLSSKGEIADLIFDRFFSSYLRCILSARVEAKAIAPRSTATNESAVIPSVRELEFPTLIMADGPDNASTTSPIPPDLIHQLVLIQRYDRHFAREMYRALSLLLVLRNGGEDALHEIIVQVLGVGKN
jgi:hypothetical protein